MPVLQYSRVNIFAKTFSRHATPKAESLESIYNSPAYLILCSSIQDMHQTPLSLHVLQK